MPVVVVDNAAAGNRAFATLNEGLGKVLRFGAYGADVLDRLRWMAGTLAPALGARSRARPGRSAEPHRAGVADGRRVPQPQCRRHSLFTRLLAPALVRTSPSDTAAAVLDFLDGNDHFYLNLSMAACKAAVDAAHDIADARWSRPWRETASSSASA